MHLRLDTDFNENLIYLRIRNLIYNFFMLQTKNPRRMRDRG